MAEFHIKGHIKREATHRYVAIVCAFPSGGRHDSEFSDMVQEAAETEALALEKLRHLTIELGKRIRGRHDEVVSVLLREAVLEGSIR